MGVSGLQGQVFRVATGVNISTHLSIYQSRLKFGDYFVDNIDTLNLGLGLGLAKLGLLVIQKEVPIPAAPPRAPAGSPFQSTRTS